MAVVREGSSLGPCDVLGPLVRETRPGSSTVPIAVKSHSLSARRAFTLNRVSAARTIRRRATPICTEPPLRSEDWPMRAMWFWAVMQL